jgi:hypothetical protein
MVDHAARGVVNLKSLLSAVNHAALSFATPLV